MYDVPRAAEVPARRASASVPASGFRPKQPSDDGAEEGARARRPVSRAVGMALSPTCPATSGEEPRDPRQERRR